MKFAYILASLLATTTYVSAQTVTIFSDDFSGSSSTNLHGTVPDTRPGTETWVSSTGTPSWKADGSVTGSGQSNAFLPFAPEAGKVYTLVAALDPSSATSTGDWLALGFTQTASVSDGFWFALSASPWMLARVSRTETNDIQTFLGPDNTNATSHSSAAGVLNLKIVLDTNETNWNVEWFLNNTSLRSIGYTANPTINYVALGKMFSAGGSVSSLTLTSYSAVPEPSSYATLLGMAAMGTILLRNRRRFQSP